MIASIAKLPTEVARFLQAVSPRVPEVAVVLGSGVNALENLEQQIQLSYIEVFGIEPTVAGHSGSLVLGEVDGHLVAVLRGRFHLYEGYDWDVVTLPTRALVEWGVEQLILTNAAGGLNQNFSVGDLMLIVKYRDHLHPRWRDEGLLPALVMDAVACENELSNKLAEAGTKLAGKESDFRGLEKGTYAGLLGPNYETLAEIEMLTSLKVDAVGMSTVPELEATLGTITRAAAISVITNVWKPGVAVEGHAEVLQAAQEASQRLDKLLRAVIVG